VIEVSVQKFLECLDYRSLAKVGRIKRGSQPVFSRVVRIVNVEAGRINPLALVGFKPGDERVTLWVDIGGCPQFARTGTKRGQTAGTVSPVHTLQQAVRGHCHTHHLRALNHDGGWFGVRPHPCLDEAIPMLHRPSSRSPVASKSGGNPLEGTDSRVRAPWIDDDDLFLAVSFIGRVAFAEMQNCEQFLPDSFSGPESM